MKLIDFKGLGPKKESAFKLAGLSTPRHLVFHLPRRYQDRTLFKKIGDITDEEEVHLVGKVVATHLTGFARNQRLQVEVKDDTGSLNLTYFNGASFWQKKFKKGMKLQIWGTVKNYGGWQIAHPEIKELQSADTPKGKIVPLYPLSEGMTSSRVDHNFIQKTVGEILKKIEVKGEFEAEYQSYLNEVKLAEALKELHFPQSFSKINQARKVLKYSELWPLCKNLEESRLNRIGKGTPRVNRGDLIDRVKEQLPFKLTQGQEEVVSQIGKVLASPDQLNGLLQGDVGSGKTIVAVLGVAQVLSGHFQTAVLLPTEILATQQFTNFQKFFAGIKVKKKPVNIALLLGSTPKAEREKVKEDLSAGVVDILVGTHVLYSSDIHYQNLGFIVIDEQHRFGVDQRNAMISKGTNPDVLYMTATPIPRTLTQSLYGDFSHFVLKEKPAFQTPVQTRLVPSHKRGSMVKFLEAEVKKSNQIFWVVPRISEQPVADQDELLNPLDEASVENQTLQSLNKLYREVSQGSPGWRVSKVHGRMSSPEKEKALHDFKNLQTDILIATTVIEVGVDVPNASIIIIENPDRFGLAQLHQIRGRVGRGGKQAWCFLALPASGYPEETMEKLQKFSESHDGFMIADMDLNFRGSGDIEGQTQSGFGHLKYTNLIRDKELVQEVQTQVKAFLSEKKKIK